MSMPENIDQARVISMVVHAGLASEFPVHARCVACTHDGLSKIADIIDVGHWGEHFFTSHKSLASMPPALETVCRRKGMLRRCFRVKKPMTQSDMPNLM